MTGSITWSRARRTSSRVAGELIARLYTVSQSPGPERSARTGRGGTRRQRARTPFKALFGGARAGYAGASNSHFQGCARPARHQGRATCGLCLRFVPLLALGIGPAAARPAPDSFADLAAKLLPTVVNIATSQTLKAPPRAAMPNVPPGSPLEDLFKNFLGPDGEQPAACHLAGLGLHHRSRRLHRHQQSCDRGQRPDHRHPE